MSRSVLTSCLASFLAFLLLLSSGPLFASLRALPASPATASHNHCDSTATTSSSQTLLSAAPDCLAHCAVPTAPVVLLPLIPIQTPRTLALSHAHASHYITPPSPPPKAAAQ
ncbi:hypothetical protein [Chitinibacter sp. ZOR0017]|uniref:hypothetical protein n=1 Tax=Chitinibacter sp. ZOR0017 TaxID=1339254 RepID=UPI00064849C3|nr:hypothetical protein [Chitinibacter sp. ZOR0017]